jgi:hypothetical protein
VQRRSARLLILHDFTPPPSHTQTNKQTHTIYTYTHHTHTHTHTHAHHHHHTTTLPFLLPVQYFSSTLRERRVIAKEPMVFKIIYGHDDILANTIRQPTPESGGPAMTAHGSLDPISKKA